MDVLCDTSFLMVIVSTPIRQLDRVESQIGRLNLLVPSIVIDELKRLQQKAGPKRSMIAKTAIDISHVRFKVIETVKSRHVDDAIVEYALRHQCAAATIDTALRKRLIKNNVLVITISNNRLIIANSRDNKQV
jgi:rRNA-processing protein FCF1